MPSSRLILEGSKDRQFGEAPRLRRTRTGMTGKLEFLVDTSNEYDAIFNSGVPDLGAGYSTPFVPLIPNLICDDQDTEYIARKDNPDGTGALTKVVCIYRELGGGGNLPPPQLGNKYTVLNLQTESQTVMFDRRWLSGGQFALPLANGDGYSRKLGSITATIYTYIPLNSWPNMARLLRLSRHKKLNSDAFTLPPILGTSVNLNLGVMQAQYEGFSHETKNQLIEFRHEISLAEDFLFYWQLENDKGEAVQSFISEIYESESFAGLW